MPDRLAWDWLGSIADVTSLVMLPVTFYTAWKVRALKRQLVFFARLRELCSGIQRTLEQVRALLETEGESPRSQVVDEIRRCNVLVYRYQRRFAVDAQERIERIRVLERRLSEVHTDSVKWQTTVDDVLTELGCLLVLARDQSASREIGGDDA